MSARRLRQDVDHATSVLLLIAVVAACVTGFIAHVWDLNAFTWHTWSGYAMAAFAVAHVALNFDRLVTYWRFRARQGVRGLQARLRDAPDGAVPAPVPRSRAPSATGGRPAAPGGRRRPGSVTRRVMLTSAATTAGALGGWAVARRIGIENDPVGNDAGMVYHRLSRPGVADAVDAVVTWGRRPAPPKEYPGAPVLDLPAVGGGAAPDGRLLSAVLERRSVRDYSDRPLTLDELSHVLFMTAGSRRQGGRAFPSSGALYPIEVYAVVNAVDGLERGLYHYDPARNALRVLRQADLRDRIADHGLGQSFLADAGVVLCLTVIPERMRFRYRHRSYRYGLLEAGHLGQNTYLAATSMGLGACAVGAFFDDALNDMLGVDGRHEAAVYLLAVGAVAP
ncbi:SagB family peptide dehydrogenase [Kineosporia sp. A_224]|uniref:SagB family peptide dehydrogenase n=1 Tax=Kineosporia sp. A_224 TaxID=1962180 RepID=UPI000B4B7914|nr:SagB family peptide dehydrogenase [Kineosporia sp. A_224]